MKEILNRVSYWNQALTQIEWRLDTFSRIKSYEIQINSYDEKQTDYACLHRNRILDCILESIIILYGTIFNRGYYSKDISANFDPGVQQYSDKLKNNLCLEVSDSEFFIFILRF